MRYMAALRHDENKGWCRTTLEPGGRRTALHERLFCIVQRTRQGPTLRTSFSVVVTAVAPVSSATLTHVPELLLIVEETAADALASVTPAMSLSTSCLASSAGVLRDGSGLATAFATRLCVEVLLLVGVEPAPNQGGNVMKTSPGT
ncbi:unnamed protein product, partial [Hapterophycus canaliculatus]